MTGTTCSAAYLASSLFIINLNSCSLSFFISIHSSRLRPSGTETTNIHTLQCIPNAHYASVFCMSHVTKNWKQHSTSFRDRPGHLLEEKVHNNEVREETTLQKLDFIIKVRRLRWSRHVLCMDDGRCTERRTL